MRRLPNEKLCFRLIDLSFVTLLLILFWIPFDLSLIFLDTHVSGGDTISHPWIARSLKNLWSQGQFWGWNDGWGAGFPFLYFYFYPVYILVNIFEFIGFSEAVAFKVMVFTIISLLPIIYYYSGLRWLKRPYAMAFTALGIFLFLNGASSYYGGNFKSVLAGQMSHHFGLVCLIFYFSYLVRKQFNSLPAILLLSLCVLSHVYSGIYAIFFTLIFWGVESIKQKNYRVLFKYLKGPLIGAGLSAFFWAPLIYYRNDTVSPVNQWIVTWQETIKILQLNNGWYLFLYSAATALTLGNLFNRKSSNRFFYLALWFLALGSAVAMPFLLNSPILHVRLIPQIFLIMILLLVACLNDLKIKNKFQYLIAGLLFFTFLQSNVTSDLLNKVLPRKVRLSFTDLPSWWKWNMSGIEQKENSKDVTDLWAFMRDLPDYEGRFAFEYFDYNTFGSPRIFELTPFMTGKSVFEALLMESSTNYPSSYYVNFLVKRQTWWPGFPLEIPKPDIKKAIEYFSLFNMKYFVAHSSAIRNLFINEKKKIIYQNKSFTIFVMNPQTRIANLLKGDLPTYSHEKPIYASVYNFPASLESRAKLVGGEESESFPKSTNQKIIPLHGYWTDQKQRYVISETSASEQNPQRILFKISYFPNWHTSTGEKVELVSPNLLMVETKAKKLEIFYRSGWVEKLSLTLSIITLFILLWMYGRSFNPFQRRHR